MDRRCFVILCHLLRTIVGLTSTKVVDVEEMVAMFLHIVAHDVKNRVIQWEFMRSETFVDVRSNDPIGYKAFATDAAPDMDFQPIYMETWRTGRRQWRSNCTAIEYKNEQLNCIVEWPVLQCQDASQTNQEVVRQLEVVSKLTLMNRCRLMRILMRKRGRHESFP
ncbi:retrotransposon protein [Cucumis melo var. makuwa]|uniref:Retrotransposon protein n=1 Tax=Cucumis melo var. makuwa TaxID=1194695 RepID=A0A5A7V7A7_CUCMM|nr:retrotransposon protein [Cucumis melo var. makuwa]